MYAKAEMQGALLTFQSWLQPLPRGSKALAAARRNTDERQRATDRETDWKKLKTGEDGQLDRWYLPGRITMSPVYLSRPVLKCQTKSCPWQRGKGL